MRCFQCASKEVKTIWTDHDFPYGIKQERVNLAVRIPVRHCQNCDEAWTDHEAALIMTEAQFKHEISVGVERTKFVDEEEKVLWEKVKNATL
jgi:hypothetical protein